MTIINLMLGKHRGGLEQAALDYAQALAQANIPALSVIAPGAWVEAPMVAAGVAHESLRTHGRFDLFAAHRLRTLARRSAATAVICHGNRALSLALRAFNAADAPKVIAVAHNYKTKRFRKADACFAITAHLAQHLRLSGAKNIHRIPNMVRLPPAAPRGGFRTPPVIGSMGRLHPVKDVPTLIESLALLQARGIAFTAILGGEGGEAARIDSLIARHRLESRLRRIGWVQNKSAFFASIDLFILPSRSEAFGLALIEAMSHGVPVISTDAEGPRAIIHPGVDGLLVPRADPEALADALAALLADPARAAALGEAGRRLVAHEYSMEAMAGRLQTALTPYITPV
ncbi:MAG: glycosyltransferase [Alphaproteobacteria bacterium]|nr:glycosyltransferase [Alphaproteobacteria bacterium]